MTNNNTDNNNNNNSSEEESGITLVNLSKLNRPTIYLSVEDFLNPEKVSQALNWRSEERLEENGRRLGRLLNSAGQLDAIDVFPPAEVEFSEDLDLHTLMGMLIARGFSRHWAISNMSAEDRAKLFPNGVAVRINFGLTAAQQAIFCGDNAMSVGLRDIYDLQQTANMLIMRSDGGERRLKIRDVLVTLDGAITDVIGDNASPEVKSAVSLLRAKLDKLTAKSQKFVNLASKLTGDDAAEMLSESQAANAEIAEIEAEITTIRAKSRQGIGDRFSNHWNCGPVADMLLYRSVFGKAHPDEELYGYSLEGIGYKVKTLMLKLGKAARDDAKAADLECKGLLRASIRNVAHTGERWGKVMAAAIAKRDLAAKKKADKAASGEATSTARAKRMDGEALKGLQSGMVSEIGQSAIAVIRGAESTKDMSPEDKAAVLKDLDTLIEIASTVRDDAPELWAKVVAKAAAIKEAKVQASAKETLAKAAEMVSEASPEEAAKPVAKPVAKAAAKAKATKGKKATK